MTGKDLERYLAVFPIRSAAELDIVGRELRLMRMVPSGGRGLSAPAYEAEHIATFLIGAYGAQNAKSAARAVLDFAPLTRIAPSASDYDVGHTFAEVLSHVCDLRDAAESVTAVRLCQSAPTAEIIWKNGAVTRFVTNPGWGGEGKGSPAFWAEIPGVVISTLIEVRDDTRKAKIVPEDEPITGDDLADEA